MSFREFFRIGNQTAASAASLEDPFLFGLEQGFRAFEWFPDKTWTEADLDSPARERIRRESEQADLRLSLHAPLGLDPLNPEDSTSEQDALDLATDLGAVVFNLHLQTESGPVAFLRAIEGLVRETAERQLLLALENTPLTGPEDFNAFFRLLRGRRDLPSDHVGLCFDLGHANLCAATRNDYLGFLDRLTEEVPVIHLHLHENHGDRDAHLPLFTGPAGDDDRGIRGLLERLHRNGFSGSAIMEVWPDPPRRLTETRDRLESLLESFPAPLPKTPARTASTHHAVPDGDESSFIQDLAEADRRNRSWREKLQGVEQCLTEGSTAANPADLAALAVYLRWLHRGRIACQEDSRHFRPHHHARAGAAIEKILLERKTPENAPIIRRILPFLPSHDTPFTQSEPLTRIRDIAHRNDIPKDLKNEIKHRLQNKLHRCAGPEDLETSKELLARVEGGDYPDEFVAEFRLFHAELEAFFNAQGLNQRLGALRESLPAEPRRDAARLLDDEHRENGRTRELLSRLRTMTRLRTGLAAWSADRADPDGQSARLAEIELEAAAFPLLSTLINRMESRKTTPWKEAMEAVSLALENLEIGETFPEEAAATRRELDTVRDRFDPGDSLLALRLKASLDRSRRLCDRTADFVIATFHRPAEELGRLLDIPERDIALFCEADLRAGPAFQLSKLVAFLARHLCLENGWKEWEPLVPGRAEGRLEAIESLDSYQQDGDNGAKRILLIGRANGEENIPAGASGLVLLHTIPHLSHLAVRARQGRVPFVFTESGDHHTELRELLGSHLRLDVTQESLTWQPVEAAANEAPAAPAGGAPDIPSPDPTANPPILPLAEVNAARAGNKADSLRRLAAHAADNNAYKVPPTLVLPFGVLDSALDAAGVDRSDILQLSGDALCERLAELRSAIDTLPVPDDILSAATETFGRDARLIVRSSSAAEDGETSAGAGIYLSVPNVSPNDLPGAIRRVWASLWEEKPWENRRRSGLPEQADHMAVILQPLTVPDVSFIAHSAHPVTRERDHVYLEAALGPGDILTSATEPGSPCRLSVSSSGDTVHTLAFPSLSHRLVPGSSGGLQPETADYSACPLVNDTAFREAFARRVAAIARDLAATLEHPQDIEGFLDGDTLSIVQSRPQPGL